MSSSSPRSLPPHPDLAQQKKLAKDLLRAHHAGDPEAGARVRAVLPDKTRVALSDAQFVLAREYGFRDWAALRHFVERRLADRRSPEERLHDAFRRHDAEEVRRLLRTHAAFRERINEPAFAFDSPAIVAFADDPAMVEVLLEAGADPNRRSAWWAGGFHPLHTATGEAAERLLAAGAQPDACAAAHLGRLDLLEWLLSDDPERVNERGGDGQTPLHFAATAEVADLLLARGADPEARDLDHRATPAQWMLARERGAGRYHLARHLMERGAATDIFLAAALGLTDRLVAMLETDRSLLDLRTDRGAYGPQPPSSYHIYFWSIGQGRTPLDTAAQFGHDDSLRAMLEFATPAQRLRLACRRGDEAEAAAVVAAHPGLVAALPADDQRAITDAAWHGDARAVALMVHLGFDPRAVGHDHGTALHCAAWEGSVETVRALLEHPAAHELVTLRDERYHATPLSWCCHGSLHGNPEHDHAGVARLLLEAGAAAEPELEASPAVEDALARWPMA